MTSGQEEIDTIQRIKMLPPEVGFKIMQEILKKQDFVDDRVKNEVTNMLNLLQYFKDLYKIFQNYYLYPANQVSVINEHNFLPIYVQIFVKPFMNSIPRHMDALIVAKKKHWSHKQLPDDIFAKICFIVATMLMDFKEKCKNIKQFEIDALTMKNINTMYDKVTDEKERVLEELLLPFGSDLIPFRIAYNLEELEWIVEDWFEDWLRNEREDHDEDRPHRKLMEISLFDYVWEAAEKEAADNVLGDEVSTDEDLTDEY